MAPLLKLAALQSVSVGLGPSSSVEFTVQRLQNGMRKEKCGSPNHRRDIGESAAERSLAQQKQRLCIRAPRLRVTVVDIED